MALSEPFRKKHGPGGQNKNIALRILLGSHSREERERGLSSECESR